MILKKNAASANKMQLQIQNTCNNFGHLLRQFAFIKLGALMIIKKMPPQIQSASFLTHTLSRDRSEIKMKSAQILQP